MKISGLLFLSRKMNGSSRRSGFFRLVRFAGIAGIALGIAALLISLTILRGFDEKLHTVASNFNAHVKVDVFKGLPITDYKLKEELLKKNFPEIAKIAPVTRSESLVSTTNGVDGIILKGMENGNDITGITKYLVKGKLPAEGKNEVVISQLLADKLAAGVGSSLTVFLMKNSETDFPEVEKFSISGIFRTGMVQYDEIYVFGDLDFISQLLDLQHGSCQSFDIMLKNIYDAPRISREIQKYMDLPYITTSVFETDGAMFNWIDLQKKPIPIVLSLISIVASFNIITVLLILIIEKTHTIGILRTLGARTRDILLIFVFRGLAIGTAGTLIGAGCARLFAFLQQNYEIIKLNGEVYFLDSLPAATHAGDYYLVIAASVLLTFLVTFLPAVRAAKIKPVTAINFK